MTSLLWHELPGLGAGKLALIVGKGPTLDDWLAAGCPRPDTAHAVIAVNHAGAVLPFAPDFNVSGHKFPEFGAIPGPWAIGINSQDSRQDEHWHLPDWATWWFLITYGYTARDFTREQIARTHRLFHLTSSTQLALHFAWYLGFEAVQFIGVDGGRAHASSLAGVPGVEPPQTDYDMLKRHTHELADRLYPGGKWWHWKAAPRAGTANREPRTGNGEPQPSEHWKYAGIYAAQDRLPGFRGYGHSNHGANAAPWLAAKHLSVLDVGCGHNEFVRWWRGSSGLIAPEKITDPATYTGVGVDFACPGADYQAPATALPFTDHQFDLVTAFDVLEHLPEPEVLPALREMARVARWYCFSIATRASTLLWQGQNLHPTVRPLDWWLDRIREAGGESEMGPAGYVYGKWNPPPTLPLTPPPAS